MTYSSNSFLSFAQMTENANYILSYLTGQGWTRNAICGILGNMQSESTINPGIWEGLNSNNPSGGFGLVQWTPSTKYINWCISRGINPPDINSNLQRILYEVENNLQFYSSRMSFAQFTQNTTLSAYDLAMIFLSAYERPANPSQPWRGEQAEYWKQNLTGSPYIPPGSTAKKKSNIFLFLINKKGRLIN